MRIVVDSNIGKLLNDCDPLQVFMYPDKEVAPSSSF